MSELEHKETMQALTLPTMALRGITVFYAGLCFVRVGESYLLCTSSACTSGIMPVSGSDSAEAR